MTKRPEEPEAPDASADPIARLLRLAGPREAAPDDRAARVRDAVHGRWREAVVRERRRRLALRIVPIAAALLIALGAGFWLRDRLGVGVAPAATLVRVEGRVLSGQGIAAGTGGVLAPGARLTTGPDGRAALRLRGGPSVRLDASSDVTLISASVLELRAGALYVDTERGSRERSPETRTIEVRTGLGRVRDVGTQFEVRLAENALRLSVREGIAALQRDDRTYSAPAGTRLRVDPTGAVESGTVAPQGEDWDWVLAVAPPFELEGRTLREYLDWLSRETGWNVTYADPSIAAGAATVVLHGSTSGLRPDQTPAVVLPTCGLSHRLEGGRLAIENAASKGENR